MHETIVEYYDKLASNYDIDRFGNTYGKYIDYQEKQIIRRLLKGNDKNKTLDMACGTGRFLEYATYGIDASEEMLNIATTKFPNKTLIQGNVLHTNFEENKFDTVLSFHLVMHLTKSETRILLDEVRRITNAGGRFIFDFPSHHRRKLVNYKADNWHASNQISIDELKEMANGWTLKQYYGILFFPIHRLPVNLRKFCRSIDNWLCRSFIRKYASYLIVILEKQK